MHHQRQLPQRAGLSRDRASHARVADLERHGLPSVVATVTLLALAVVPARANHGPGTSGGGSSTASGETLKAGAFSLDLQFNRTEFESVHRDEAERRAVNSGEFDALRNSSLSTFSLAYGVTDDFQLGGTLGYYAGQDFIDAEFDPGTGEAESATADPEGITDLWLQAKYRLLRGAPGSLSLLLGVKLPIGKDDEKLDNGERLEPSSQPGSGAWDAQAGLAWSRFLTSELTLDASALYTLRGEDDDFQVGDRIDLGTALAWRLTESIQQFPQWSVFGELTLVHLMKDDDDGTRNDNSGGTTLYGTPGVRVRFSPRIALTVAPSVPLWQDQNGDQIETRYKVAAALSFTF